MKRLYILLSAALLLATGSATVPGQPAPRPRPDGPRGVMSRDDPLAAATRVRALADRIGLPPMGRGRITPAARRMWPRLAAGQMIVRFRPGVSTQRRSVLHATVRARVLSEIPGLGIQTVTAPASALAAYRKDPTVLWAEPNPMRYPLVADPTDPAYTDFDTGLPTDPIDATWFKWDAHLIDCVPGWSLWPGRYFTSTNKGTAAVRLAVIDTGIDYTHPDFINAGGTTSNVTGGGQLYRSLDRTMFNGSTTADAWDAYGHGTHVTGIAAAATNNGIGTIGNGYNAQVISIRITDANGNGTASDLARAITYAADNGAVVCNISLGDYLYSQAEQDAVNYAWGKGMLVIAAAGNDGGTNPPPLMYPAALSRVLAVSATSSYDELASYSSWGDPVGLCAPGGDLDWVTLSLLPVYSTTPTYTVTLNDPNVYGMAQNYDYLMGTSMASPQVAGLAVLYAGMKGITQATPGGPLRIWQALQRGADALGGWSSYYGFGRINVYNTLNLDAVPNPRGDTVGCITGQVRYRGTPVQNANIVATPTGAGTTSYGTSRSDGGYRVPNAPAGTYNVSATYFGETQTATGVVVSAGCDMPGIDFNIGVATGAALKSVTASPNPVAGGKAATATVTLVAAAPSGGVQVSVASSNTTVASPAVSSITIAAGATSGKFTVNTTGVTTNTSAVISASSGSSTVSTTLTVRPAGITSVVFSPNPVVGSLNASGTVTLEAPAPAGGLSVTLSSGNTAVANVVTSPLTVAQGATTAKFSLTTSAVAAKTIVTLTATANGLSKAATLTVRPIGVYSVALSPAAVVGGFPSTGTVTLEAAAGPGSITVALSSNNPSVAAPAVASISIPAGTKTGTFTVNTFAVAAITNVTIAATANGIAKTKTLTVNPQPVPKSVTVSPNPVAGGKTATGTVTLVRAAPPGGTTVALSSSLPGVANPTVASVLVAAGTTSKTFSVATKGVATDTVVQITAAANGGSASASLTVRRVGVYSVSCSPNPVRGPLSTTATVTLEAVAPTGGVSVSLASSNTAVAHAVTSPLTVPAGARTVKFTVATAAVAARTAVTMTASANGISRATTLTVRPIGVYSVALSPNPVVGGSSVTGTVTLEDYAAPASITVTLTSSNTAVAAPAVATITIPAGAKTGTFTVTTSHVAATTTAVITAAANGISKTKTLTVNP